jgi:glycosyltransferase involved in cell wall biosynthesis
MRLLVLDEAWQAIGGVDTFRRFLLPALVPRVEKLWWANPACVHSRRLTEINLQGIEVLDTFPPTRSPAGLASAILRRLPPRWFPAARARVQIAFSRHHLRRLVRQLGVTHLLEICIFRHPFPHCGIPVIGMVHDLDYPNRGHSPIDAVFRDWLKNASLIFADASQGRDELLELEPSAGDHIQVITSPPTAPPNPRPPRAGSRFRGAAPVLYYPAVSTPRKNHPVLLAALAELAARQVPFHCFFSGIGTDQIFGDQPLSNPDAESLRQNCRPWLPALQGRITGLGAQPWSVVEELYAAADVVVLPTRYEGFGLPMGEALCRGVPVVASRVPTFEEQVAHYQAQDQVRWVPPGDPAALAETLAGVLTGAAPFPPFPPELSGRLAAWTWEAFADRVVAALAAARA